jgi:hypothetical protein
MNNFRLLLCPIACHRCHATDHNNSNNYDNNNTTRDCQTSQIGHTPSEVRPEAFSLAWSSRYNGRECGRFCVAAASACARSAAKQVLLLAAAN